VLVVDKSGSMGNFSKMDSAKQAGRLYVDSWRTGDKIAVESFNGTPSVDLTLRNWTDTPSGGSRLQAFNTITGFVAGGSTAIGEAILAGWEELKARGIARTIGRSSS
jgi:Mg-chelatase subunit ChlD